MARVLASCWSPVGRARIRGASGAFRHTGDGQIGEAWAREPMAVSGCHLPVPEMEGRGIIEGMIRARRVAAPFLGQSAAGPPVGELLTWSPGHGEPVLC